MALWHRLAEQSEEVTVQGYSFPSPGIEELKLLLDGKELTFIRKLIGQNYQTWKQTNTKRKDARQFLDELFEEMGIPKDSAWSAIGIIRNDEFLRALEADLIIQGWSVEELFSGDMTFSRLALIIDHLPDSSNLLRKIAGPAANWTLEQYMLADMIDIVNYQTVFLMASAQGAGMTKIPKPPRAWYTRPVVPPKEKPVFTKTEDAIAFFNSI